MDYFLAGKDRLGWWPAKNLIA